MCAKLPIVFAGLVLACAGFAFPGHSQQERHIAQGSSCHFSCDTQRRKCERSCNENSGSMLHVKSCFERCERSQAGCASRCR